MVKDVHILTYRAGGVDLLGDERAKEYTYEFRAVRRLLTNINERSRVKKIPYYTLILNVSQILLNSN